ncbi:MAG: hypothetical protein ABI634_12310, partial [Acidobacteriota bacterium]
GRSPYYRSEELLMSPIAFRAAAASTLLIALAWAGPAAGQVPARGANPRPGAAARPLQPVEVDGRNADQIRNDFRELMRQYPPALGEVLKLDPALMTNENYLQTYPGLAAFFAAHPEVPRDPGYFLEFANTSSDVEREYAQRRPYSPVEGQIRDIFTFLAAASAVGGIAFVLIWLVRTILSHRRWLRSTKLQMDIHNRLMERLSSSADVQAYLESAATNRLLLDMPVMNDGPARVSAPINRIMWSVQTGIVLGMAGIGLLIGQRYWPDSENVLTIPGVLILAVGVGFVLASAASYILSVRLGLLEPIAGAPNDRPRV